jgi:large subunit ribosomal protein L31
MNKDIQPTTHKVKVKCQSCGNEFETHSTSKEITIDVCSNCHPFYTGKLSSGSKAGRVERFNRKFGTTK